MQESEVKFSCLEGERFSLLAEVMEESGEWFSPRFLIHVPSVANCSIPKNSQDSMGDYISFWPNKTGISLKKLIIQRNLLCRAGKI